MIAGRVVQSSAGDKVRASLGFPSAKVKCPAPLQSPRSHTRSPKSSMPKPPLFSKPARAGQQVTPRNLLRPGQPTPPEQGQSTLITGWKAQPAPPLRLLSQSRSISDPGVTGGGSARSPNKVSKSSLLTRTPRKSGRAIQSAIQNDKSSILLYPEAVSRSPRSIVSRRSDLHQRGSASSLMPVSKNGPHATRIEQSARELGRRKPGGDFSMTAREQLTAELQSTYG